MTALYLTLEGTIMDYGRDLSHPLFLRLLPVLLIQFGMSCLGAPLPFNVIGYLVNDYMRAEWCWEEHAGKRL